MHAHIDITGKNVLIIGRPASGKSYTAEKLARDNPNHVLIKTDDYKHLGYVEALYAIIDDLKVLGPKVNTIVEGVQGYRLLRKGVELNCYYPDMVIELEITDRRMNQTYILERDPKKLAYLKGFNKAHEKVLNDYREMQNKHKPKWIKLKNNY